jgi:hypothetical protein
MDAAPWEATHDEADQNVGSETMRVPISLQTHRVAHFQQVLN